MTDDEPATETLFTRFLHSQTAGSLVLLLAAITAIAWANSRWAGVYASLSHLDIGTYIGGQPYHLSLAHWVKDGLMTIFFFVVGLEIKREILIGELSSFRRAILPVMAACGGALFPAALYALINWGEPTISGWGISMATDIAFALGVLALFQERAPVGLKVFLTALAIVDDLIAVLVIAIFYTGQISLAALTCAAVLLLALLVIIRRGVRRPGIHLLLCCGIWLCVLVSGVHATVAGVLIAFVYPVKATIDPNRFLAVVKDRIARLAGSELTRRSMVENKKQLREIEDIYLAAEDMIPAGIYLEQQLHSVQAFFILPLFALFSAGVAINSAMFQDFPSSAGLGVLVGLLFGKPLGIMLFSFLTVKSAIAELARDVSWSQLFGVALLSGVGFTMSIFISELSFQEATVIDDAKIAIFIASVAAAMAGYMVLHLVLPKSGRKVN